MLSAYRTAMMSSTGVAPVAVASRTRVGNRCTVPTPVPLRGSACTSKARQLLSGAGHPRGFSRGAVRVRAIQTPTKAAEAAATAAVAVAEISKVRLLLCGTCACAYLWLP